MQINNLKKKLRSRELVFGSWVSFSHPSISEIFASHKFDFLAIDMEHGTINLEQAQRIIAASQFYQVPCLPRPVSHSNDWIKPLLDSGADGLIAPMVNAASELKNLVDLVKYPNVGKRSFGINRAQGYGNNFDDYVASWNENSVFVAQVETKEAVNEIHEITNNSNLDAIMIGPVDLSGSLGVPGQKFHPSVKEAELKVIDACYKAGISCGTQLSDFNPNSVKAALEMGYTFIIASSDLFVLEAWANGAEKVMQEFRK
jgi:2-keto-3-deoxy-L-rhamnonate aldolase RhmA